ncbi:phage tail tape measure protein [Enterobacter hormaechei]|uniref:phage tail tape measure protein n=1 Tax=Enterobacter hormaechei TaxID=158836 RepID=UPI001E28BA32|nr:phage tail tape measure protein [Enterobacter hormaechei]ELS5112487.1 phage tail tape measure protein [Salmonella enterica]HDR2785543.1 phage tail tape measure protein [Enterobacter sichuanensis]MCE4085178.1 phage tail tape measure protein [Enterobacter hormaechei]MCU7670808.1 phage tail tape measure protein [Enterobacter hormaechei]UIL46825.1 phage tail tape measure protein [Enterobacter hormaechei]
MASEFSVGVIIGGIVGSSFRSAVSGTRRALDSLGDTSRRLQERQNALTRATERYGQLGSSRMQRLNSELLRVSRTMEQIERQQRRLSAVSATSDALKANRMALYGQGAETYAIGRTLGAPVMASVKQYASFESQLRDISVTGDLDAKQERAIGLAIRQASLKINQLQESLMGGVGQLVADGMAPEQAATFAEMLGKTATATKADMTDLAKMTYAFSDALKITDAKELEQAFGMAATGAKLGSFELKDMAKALPGMTKAFAARGITGKEAIMEIVSSLEVGKGSGSAEEAVTNMSNWLAAMGRNDTIQKYAKAGINYQKSMQNLVAQGFSQYESSLMIANAFIDDKGKAFVQQWEKAGAVGDREGQQKLMESFGLAEVFTDIQTVNHLLSMRQGWDKYLSNKQEMKSPTAQNTLSTDFTKQNDTLEARWRRTQVGFNEAAISIGESLRPALIQLGETFIPLMDSVGKWIAANPQLVSGTIKVVGALLAFKMATIGLKLGLNLLISPFVNVWKNAVLLRANWLRLTLALGEGGKLRWLVTGFSAVARGARTLGGVLSGGLVRGIMIAGRAVLWIGRALLMNPIGLAITAVAAAAYLIYRNWGAVSNWFKQRWADIKTAFNGGIVGIGKLLLNWSPVGLLYKAFAGALKYLGIDLPAQFTDFGGHLIDGLVNGIKNKWESVKSTVSDLGDNVGGWFKEKLGIHSPSRVFMGFGDNIAQGASIGIKRTTPAAALAGQQMANQLFPNTPPSIQGPKIIDNTSGFRLGMPSLDTDGLLSSARDKLGGVINSLSSMPAIRLSTAATALPEQRRAGEINQNAYSLPSPDISGLLSFARNAFGELINSLSPMPAMRIPAAAPTLTGQRIANEMTPDVPRIPSPEIMAAGYSGHGAASTGGGTSGGIQVSFNPQFFLNGKETAAPDGLTGALNMSLHELEKMLERLLAQQQRRRYS